MELLVDNPTTARYVLKYVPKTHKFLLKITDGQQIVMKKCKGEVSLISFRNQIRFKSSPFWQEEHSRMNSTKKLKNKFKMSKKEIKRKNIKRKDDIHSLICHHHSFIQKNYSQLFHRNDHSIPPPKLLLPETLEKRIRYFY